MNFFPPPHLLCAFTQKIQNGLMDQYLQMVQIGLVNLLNPIKPQIKHMGMKFSINP